MAQPRTIPPGWWTEVVDGVEYLRRPTDKPLNAGAKIPVDGKPMRLIIPGSEMTETEKELELILKGMYPKAKIYFEAVTFLCVACKYKPDFMVKLIGQSPIFYECKRKESKREKDILRLKDAAAQYPFTFILAEKSPDGWQYAELPSPLANKIYA